VTTNIEVLLGAPVEDPNENHILHRLCTDLLARGIGARIYANFVVGRYQRQIDAFVVTDHRAVHAELKLVDLSRSIVAPVNGPWQQVLPDGSRRQLGHYFRQAHTATYALSDAMAELAASRTVPPPVAGKFYKHIDTVICVSPEVPAGSALDNYDHVDVVGYADLLDRLSTDGPRPPWTTDDWDAFNRHLGVYPLEDDSPATQKRRAQAGGVDDYCLRYAQGRSGLHRLVPLTLASPSGTTDEPIRVVAEAVRDQKHVLLVGVSGGGKSHLAEHVGVTMAAGGGLPVWLRCGEFQPGRFDVLLARAVAPYTTEGWLQLLRSAADLGRTPVLVLDGVNECPATLQAELLEQTAALCLRVPAGVLLTSTTAVAAAGPVMQLRVQLPNEQQRQALVRSHGAPELFATDEFRTPLELAIIAECASELTSGAGRAELFDSYVRRRTGSHRTRVAARLIAAEMNRQVRSSLTVREASVAVERAESPSASDIVDAVLTCHLVTVSQGRVAFSHDAFGRFLAAEQLVHDAPNATTLAHDLRDPRNGDLTEFAVGLETDEGRRRELLLALADADLLAAAVRGRFGEPAATHIRLKIREALAAAGATTNGAVFVEVSDGQYRWNCASPRTAVEQALLVAAGIAVRDGEFVDEVAALLDHSDDRCAQEMRTLREAGYRTAISAVVQATYTQMSDRNVSALPATTVVQACEHDGMMRRFRNTGDSLAAATLLRACRAVPRWGQLYTVLLLVNANAKADLELLPDLLAGAWKEGGYHLRLRALMGVSDVAGVVDERTANRIREVLTGLEVPNHVFLSSTLVEALAAYGEIEPMTTLDAIGEQVLAALNHQDDPERWVVAQHAIAMMFEDEAIVGPYSEALAQLTGRQRFDLCVMAMRASFDSFHTGWILQQIVARVTVTDTAAVNVLEQAAEGVDRDNPMQQEAVLVHLLGLRGLAAISAQLPLPPTVDGGVGHRAWRLVDELLFDIFSTDESAEVQANQQRWAELLDLCAPAAVDVLFRLYSARAVDYSREEPSALDRLVKTYPAQVRQLLEWGLRHRDQIETTTRDFDPTGRDRFLIYTLGHVGDPGTAELLRALVGDSELGADAVAALRELEPGLNGIVGRDLGGASTRSPKISECGPY
jgi:hypothetical protein